MSTRFNSKGGFSLLELIFVILVIGIIASVAVPKLSNTKSDAIVVTIKKDLTSLISSIQSYSLMNGTIQRLEDVIELNRSYWDVSDLVAKFEDNNKECIIVKVVDSTTSKQLQITINQSGSQICNKLIDAGIRDVNYDLY